MKGYIPIGEILYSFEKMKIKKIEKFISEFEGLYSIQASLEFLNKAFDNFKELGNSKLISINRELKIVINLENINKITLLFSFKGNITNHVLYVGIEMKNDCIIDFYDLETLMRKGRKIYFPENQIVIFPPLYEMPATHD